MILTSDVKLQERLKGWAKYLALALWLIALMQWFGIYFDIAFLRRPFPNSYPMNIITVIGMNMLAIAFLLRTAKNSMRFNQPAATILASFVLLSAIIRFLSYALRNYINIQVLFNRESISSSTAFCAILAALILLLLNKQNSRRITLSHYLSVVIFLFAIFNIFVNSYHAQSFIGIFTVPMAFFSAVGFMLFSVATLFANPDKGLMKELTTIYAGSIAARRLIPAALILPFIYGFVRLYGEWAGFYNKEFGTALSVLAVTVTCLVFIILNTRLLNRRDIVNEQSKSELTEANYFLYTVLENIPHMIFVKDAKELRFFRFNKAGEELLGYSKDDLIGKNDYDFFPKEQADFFTMKDRDVINSDTMLDIPEEPIITKHGERWLHTKKIPVRDEYGNPLYLLGISEDITERRKIHEQLRQLNAELERKVEERTAEIRRSEARFRKLLENNYEIISLADENFIPFYRNPSADRVTGWTLEESVKAGGGMNNVHPEDVEKVRNAVKEVFAESGKAVQVSFRTRHKKGHYILLEGFITNMLHDETLNGIVSNFRDVTATKQAEEEILVLTKELRQLLEHTQASREEERKYIAREIHDELGQRLTALKMDVSMMRRKIPVNGSESLPAGQAGYFTKELNSVISQIDQSIESVKRIATDLRPEILDHHGIIAAVKWQANQFENITGVRCNVLHLPDDMNLESELSTAVYRTVQEALTNIARHAQATSVNILIELDSNKLLVEIKDNGKGIDEGQIKSMKSLGLIGIRERVNLLKGTISITGTPGKGTVVSVNIPV